MNKEINQKIIGTLIYPFISREHVNFCTKCHQVIISKWMIVVTHIVPVHMKIVGSGLAIVILKVWAAWVVEVWVHKWSIHLYIHFCVLYANVCMFQKLCWIFPIDVKLPIAHTKDRDVWPDYWVGFSTHNKCLISHLLFVIKVQNNIPSTMPILR